MTKATPMLSASSTIRITDNGFFDNNYILSSRCYAAACLLINPNNMRR